nr:DUF4157 domain-containing protein [uncultured Rhodopila sp.]
MGDQGRRAAWSFDRISISPPDLVATGSQPGTRQRQLAVGRTDDPQEQEADRAADAVMQNRAPATAVRPASTATDAAFAAPDIVHAAMQSGGNQLGAEHRRFFETRFGHDFSNVRVHSDAAAAAAAQAIQARAYSIDEHIVLGAGANPEAAESRHLLAHELAHVVQQSRGAGAGIVRRVPLGKSMAAPVEDEKTPDESAVKVRQLDYAFIFAHDAFGNDARRFIKTFYPGYRLIEARSLEGMIDRLWEDTKDASETNRFRVRHLIIVSHGIAEGVMTSVNLTESGKATFTYPDMVKLQQEVKDGLHKQMASRREAVISRAIDENTDIEIKGCRIGQSEGSLTALRSFFGGEASVSAPATYQGFDTVKVPGPVFKDKDSAYDALLGSRIDLPEKLVCRPDETKAACIDRNFPGGLIPTEFFVVSDKDHAGFKAIDAKVKSGKESVAQGQAEAEPLKHRDPSAADTRTSLPSALGQVSVEDSLSIPDIEKAAKWHLDHYTKETAYVLVALRRAWTRKHQITNSMDPLEGLPPESIFGDPNIVGPDASHFPGPTTAVDPFITETLEKPSEVEANEKAARTPGEDQMPEPDPAPAADAARADGQSATPPAAPVQGPRGMVLPEDTIHALPPAKVLPPGPGADAAPAKAAEPPAGGAKVEPAPSATAEIPGPAKAPVDRGTPTPAPAPITPAPGPSLDKPAVVPSPPAQQGKAGQKPGPAQRPKAGRSANAGRAAVPDNGDMVMPEDRITVLPMPTPALDAGLYKPLGGKDEIALVVRGEFARQFEIKFEKQLGYLKVKKAVVEFNGKIDFKGEGKKELLIGALGSLASKPGESVSLGGDKLELTAKAEDKGTGVTGKVSGGLNIAGQGRTKGDPGEAVTRRGMKSQLYLGCQVAWGPIAQELKLVILGIDETKTGTDMWTVLGIDWSPLLVQGDFDLPVTDGTKVKFSGTAKLTISAEPDWPKIAARLAPLIGRGVATEGAIVAGGASAAAAGGAAAGVGGAEAAAAAPVVAGLGEIVIVSGFAAGIIVMIYSYFKTIQDIEDLKELQRASDAGVADFAGGYLAHLGIGVSTGKGLLASEGARLAEINLTARMARAQRFLADKYPTVTLSNADLRGAVLGGIAKDAKSWRKAVYLTYETAIRTAFFKAWREKMGERTTPAQVLNARARAGVSSVDLADDPDYAYINAVGSNAAQGMRLPSNVR